MRVPGVPAHVAGGPSPAWPRGRLAAGRAPVLTRARGKPRQGRPTRGSQCPKVGAGAGPPEDAGGGGVGVLRHCLASTGPFFTSWALKSAFLTAGL